MVTIRASIILVIFSLFCACSDQTKNGEGDASSRILTLDANIPAGDVYIIEPDPPDVFIDPCEDIVSSSQEGWCTCQPQCCQSQQWFCPPELGNPAYFKKEVVVDICNENNLPCTYGNDADCPPPEIIYSGECEEAYECPPAVSNLDYGWQWCELPDGAVGKQHVICDKGMLKYTPCQGCDPEQCDNTDNDCDGVVDEDLSVSPCTNDCGAGNAICINGEEVCFGPEPQEEICDHLDNDCDGTVDEFQTNVCGMCGPTPVEQCDGLDNNCNGETDEELVQGCETVCGPGIEICSDGNWSGCTAQQPQAEICDGLDNDCNGLIDDGLECLCTIQDVGALFPCGEPPLLCGQGFKTCECVDPGCQQIITTSCFSICHWLANPPGSDNSCNSFVGMPLNDEECNNFDDNCNQQIDEDLTAACYSGPPDTLNVGICLPGIMTCSAGTWGGVNNQNDFIPGLCADETVPQDEICDGVDNDCDGQADWGEEIPDTDILFIVDWSGSMDDEINAVLVALNQFAANYADQESLRWGLIVGPKASPVNPSKEHLVIVSDISPFPDFLADFAALGNEGMDTGKEMLLDAIYLALQNISGNAPIDLASTQWIQNSGSDPEKEQFNLEWRQGADRVIIVFTDEVEQSYLNPEITLETVVNVCQGTPSSKLYTFSTNLNWNWDELADTCNGTYFPLTDNALDMYNNLTQILEEICLPPEEAP